METSVKRTDKNAGEQSTTEDTTETVSTCQPESSVPKEDFWFDYRYYVLKFLGEGAFGAVFLVYDHVTRQYFALKMPKSKQYQPMFQREIEVMLELQEGNQLEGKAVIQLRDYNIGRGVMISSQNIVYATDVTYLVTDYADGGDLAAEIIKNVEKYRLGIPETDWFKVFQQLLEGLEALHEQGFVHLDLKPDNFLTSHSKVAIADFALAKEIKGEDNRGNFLNYKVGAKQYWSPEMFSSLPYNGVQSDLYALGVTLFVITFGWWPFQLATLDDIHFRKLVQNPVEFWKWHPETERRISENTVSPDLVKLINYMLCPYPQYRLSIKQIKQQKWYVDNLALATTLNVDQNSWTDSDVATEEAPDSDISSNEGENESSEDDIIC